jgi:hypothetical protein
MGELCIGRAYTSFPKNPDLIGRVPSVWTLPAARGNIRFHDDAHPIRRLFPRAGRGSFFRRACG